jgi:hypothetical protein
MSNRSSTKVDAPSLAIEDKNIIPDELHGFLRHENWIKVYRASADFFDRYFRARKK